MHPVTPLALFLLAQEAPTIEAILKYGGPLSLFGYLVVAKLFPALINYARPRQERQLKREEEQAKRVADLEIRQVEAWEKIALATSKYSDTLPHLVAVVNAVDKRLSAVEQDTGAIRADMAKINERTASCPIRTQARTRRKEVQ